MTDNQDKINQLLDRLETLLRRQDDFSKEISNLRIDIEKLKTNEIGRSVEKEEAKQSRPMVETGPEVKVENRVVEERYEQQVTQEPPKQIIPPVNKPPKVRSDIEKFIGENLANKIGIAITIIGVAIGAKYSIEHDLISPLARIIVGYLTGLGLLGFGIKLKKKYESYSAVLVSGAMAILYFITYFAYGFYGLIPQVVAFALMVIFTAFTVVAALNYNRQVIAHIGLVGAYAVPFLLSENSGKLAVLFTYMAIINIGVLVIAFKKYWKPLYYSSFGLTWLIYFLLHAFDYQFGRGLGLTFLFICFATFYLILLAYKLLKEEKFETDDIWLLLTNSFIFYVLGYNLLHSHETSKPYLGLFTLSNAVVHFVVSVIIYKKKSADRVLFHFISGLVLVFITIAIPVQLDGNRVTLLWAGEATLLFWIGRTKNALVYEKLSYPLMGLAFFSIVPGWLNQIYHLEDQEARVLPLMNTNFLLHYCSLQHLDLLTL